ncbi:MAG TPA: hypothetical protein VK689_04425 [Armatimonadota bacterium]|nr:hypothetical protein [Armatimonadota bacterium]
MARDRAVESLAALLRGDTPECRQVLRGLTVAQRTALADGCHMLLAEIGRANLEEEVGSSDPEEQDQAPPLRWDRNDDSRR